MMPADNPLPTVVRPRSTWEKTYRKVEERVRAHDFKIVGAGRNIDSLGPNEKANPWQRGDAKPAPHVGRAAPEKGTAQMNKINTFASFVISMAFAITLPTVGHAQDAFFDFEDMNAGNYTQGSNTDYSTRLGDQYLALRGIRFNSLDTDFSSVAVIRLGLNHATSGYNGFTAIDENGKVDQGGAIEFTFFVPDTDTTNPRVPGTVDFFSMLGDLKGAWSQNALISAYDIDGNELALISVNDSGGAEFTLSVPGMHQIIFWGSPFTRDTGSYGIGLDDLTFGQIVPAVPAAPAPVTLEDFDSMCAADLVACGEFLDANTETIEVETIVEVPYEVIVETIVEVEKIVYVEVEKIVEVETIVYVEVEKIVEVPAECTLEHKKAKHDYHAVGSQDKGRGLDNGKGHDRHDH